MKKPAPMTDLKHAPEMLTIREIAAIYRLHPGTIRNQLRAGTFHPKPRWFNPMRWSRDEVIRFVHGPRPAKAKLKARRFPKAS